MEPGNLPTSEDGAGAANPGALPPGTVLDGKYRITSFIGCGGMGSVYRAQHLELDKEVAIKTMHPRFSAETEAVARFQREAHIICELHHKNILAVYAFGIDKRLDLLYMAMEFIEGISLARLITERGAISPQQAMPVLRQICDAMIYAHANHVLHRDLKPDNVLIANADSADPIVKVVDFGLAKLTDAEMQKLTSTGMVVGDPHYMSPEQAQGRVIDGRSDIYSFGCLMYEMLAGQRPFEGESTVAVLYKQIGESPPPFFDAKTNLARSCHSIVFEAMEKSADKRYQSFQDIAIQLAKLEADPDAKIEGSRLMPSGGIGSSKGKGKGKSGSSQTSLSAKAIVRALAVVLLVAVLPAVSFLILNPGKLPQQKVDAEEDGYSTLSTADVRARVNQLLSWTRDSQYDSGRAEASMKELEEARKHIGNDPYMQGRIDVHRVRVLRLRDERTHTNTYQEQIDTAWKSIREFDDANRITDAHGLYTAVNQTMSVSQIRREMLYSLEVIRQTAQDVGDYRNACPAAKRILELCEFAPIGFKDSMVENSFVQLIECSMHEGRPEEVEKIAQRALTYYKRMGCDASFLAKQRSQLSVSVAAAKKLSGEKRAAADDKKQKHHPN